MTFPAYLNQGNVRSAVLGFMEARCDVTSQHKLPSLDEILSTQFAAFLGEGRVRLAVQQLLKAGELRDYDGYLSDREIDVL